jgi:hypothetical protein
MARPAKPAPREPKPLDISEELGLVVGGMLVLAGTFAGVLVGMLGNTGFSVAECAIIGGLGTLVTLLGLGLLVFLVVAVVFLAVFLTRAAMLPLTLLSAFVKGLRDEADEAMHDEQFEDDYESDEQETVDLDYFEMQQAEEYPAREKGWS